VPQHDGPTFVTYLTQVVGQAFSPPLSFSLVPIENPNSFDMTQGQYDFAFISSGVATCQYLIGDGCVWPIAIESIIGRWRSVL
jgi:hypothetical protein